VFEWAKTVHALDRAATVIGYAVRGDGKTTTMDNKMSPHILGWVPLSICVAAA
jgi:hypothetical protein